MMRRPLSWGVAIPALVTLLLSGCSNLDTTSSYPNAQSGSVKTYRFPDVPVPAGLSIVSGESFILETPDTHAGQLVYTGFANFQSVVRFYRQKMPNHGWNLLSSIERGEAALTYEKPGWSAVIFIRTSYFQTRVSINIGPKGANVEQDIPQKR